MNEFDIKKELEEKRSKIEDFDGLVAFLKDVKDNYNTDYGVAPRAIAQASLAVAWYLAGEFGITGFQAGLTMFDFIKDWEYRSNKCGLKIIDFDNMLFPQYEHRYEKTIPDWVWEQIQKEAEARLANCEDYVHPAVRKHWQSIVDGKIPFGYEVSN